MTGSKFDKCIMHCAFLCRTHSTLHSVVYPVCYGCLNFIVNIMIFRWLWSYCGVANEHGIGQFVPITLASGFNI